MSWIKMRENLKAESEVFGICNITGLEANAVLGSLFMVWSWADGRTEDGFIDHVRKEQVDKVAEFDGFAAAMESVGWIVFTETGVQFPNFEAHMSESAKKRDSETKRKRIQREKAKRKQRDIVPPTPGQCPTSDRDKSVTREEKRREELIKEKEKKESSDSQSDDCSPSPDSRIPKVEQLDALIDAFELLPESIGHQIRDRRGKSLLKGWRRVQKDPETRQAFEDIPALMTRIRDGTFLHGQGWFKFPWLFAKGRDGQWNVLKILEGQYVDGKPKQQHRDPARIAGRPSSLRYFEKGGDAETRPG